jgi:predicted nuclease of restriction endonuclease-like RecB superfamily
LSESTIFFIIGGFVFVTCFAVAYWIVRRILKYFKRKYIPKIATSFKCLDGHVVRSKGELIIDNHLHRLGIEHEYENTIRVRGMPIKYDWYLPKIKIYIEYWGYFGKDYMKRKEEKLRLYRKGKLKLVSIEDIMVKDIYTNLEKELNKFMKKEAIKRHCPNCGVELDKRFYDV